MAYSDPRTWVTGELVTAALMNAQLRDNLDAVIEGTTGAYVNAVTGPHAIGGSTVDYVRLGLTGAFTSGGASTIAFGLYTSGVLTGHSGDSAAIAGIKANNSIVTAGNCTTIAQLWVSDPQITVGAGAVTNSATVYIEGAASEATNDYALWVDAGATQLDGSLDVAGAVTINDAGSDIDTRIESDDNANMLFVDGGNDRVGIGTNVPSQPLTVSGVIVAQETFEIATPTVQSNKGVGVYVGGQSNDEVSVAVVSLTDDIAGTSRAWSLVNGRTDSAQTVGTLNFLAATANSQDPLDGAVTVMALDDNGDVEVAGTMTATQYLTGTASVATDAATNLYASSGASGSNGGMIAVRDGYSRFGLFWYGSYDTLTKLAGNAVYSASKDNASTINIYYESGNIVYQNKTTIASLSLHYTRILD